MGRAKTTWQELSRGISVPADEQHTLVVERNYADVIEIDERHFTEASSVLLPTKRADDEEGRAHSGLTAIAHALRYAKEHGDRKLAVLAHDSARDVGLALVCSERRAQNVHAVLTGDKAAFASSCFYRGVETPTELLSWASRRFGYRCEPVVPPRASNAESASALQDAVQRFRQAHNERKGTSLTGSGALTPADMEAFFDLYDEELAELLEVEPAELPSFRSALVFCAPPWLGCGKRWPAPGGPDAEQLISATTRRVDLTFFETAVALPDLSVKPPGAQVYASQRYARCIYLPPEAPPAVKCVRFTGMFFDSNKCFPLPSCMRGVRKLISLYEKHPNAELLIVGHTDTAGRPQYNEQLSVERAKAVAAFLKDEVDAWLEWYGDGKPQLKRWGSGEDMTMLRALPDGGTHMAAPEPIRSYQESRGLDADNIIGPNTRKQLIKDYMALDGTTLPASITPVVHGCGESFPEVPTEDEVEQDENRRVELFLFDGGIEPAPPGEVSKPGSTEYAKWRGKVVEEHGFWTANQRDFDIAVRINRDADTHDGSGYALDSTDGTEIARVTADSDDVFEDLARKLRFFRFREIPLGSYSLHQIFHEEKICVLVDLVVAPDGVYLHGEPLAQGEDMAPSEPLPHVASNDSEAFDEDAMLC